MSMKGRIEELGGTMTLASAPGSGTQVEFRLPGEDQG
jgi:signal transduction histidine kinase